MHEINEAFKNPEILQCFGYTLGSKDIFFDAAIDTGNFSFCVFSSKKMINLLNKHVPNKKLHILMDATFRTCPFGPFNQLLILYARIHHQVSKKKLNKHKKKNFSKISKKNYLTRIKNFFVVLIPYLKFSHLSNLTVNFL